jgi:hypothetical protein
MIGIYKLSLLSLWDGEVKVVIMDKKQPPITIIITKTPTIKIIVSI